MLIKKYGSVEGVIAALDELTPARRKLIEDGMEMLLLSKELAEIHCTIDVNDRIEDLEIPVYDKEKRELIEEQGYSMIVRQANSLFNS